MTDDYIPTLGEYAEIIERLTQYPNLPVPEHMQRAYQDARRRADLRRFARMMDDMLDAAEFSLGYRPPEWPEWQMVWLNADFRR